MTFWDVLVAAVRLVANVAGFTALAVNMWRWKRIDSRRPLDWRARYGATTQALWLVIATTFSVIAAVNVIDGGWYLLGAVVNTGVAVMALFCWVQTRGWYLTGVFDSGASVPVQVRHRPGLVRELDRWYGRGGLTHYCVVPGVWLGMLVPPSLSGRLMRALAPLKFPCTLCGAAVPVYQVTPDTLIPDPLAAPSGFCGICQSCAAGRVGRPATEPVERPASEH